MSLLDVRCARHLLNGLFSAAIFSLATQAFSAELETQEGLSAPDPKPVDEIVDQDDSTVTYPAEFFTQYEPISAQDMLNRIPGINSIIGGGGGNNDRRGLGAGENQILINGKRLAGKENDGRSVLGQIAASQVSHIEIIRGTSAELDIRSAGPIVNVVLRENASRATITAEVNADYYQQDGHVQPGAVFSINGRGEALNYLATVEMEPRYEQEERNEYSVLNDGSPKDRTFENRVREQTNYKFSSTLGYQMSDDQVLQLNALYEKNDPPRDIDRTIWVLDPNDFRQGVDYLNGREFYQQRDASDAERFKWEFGFNYVQGSGDTGQYKIIGIFNEEIDSNQMNRFSDLSGPSSKILFINDQRRYRERIIRTSFNRSISDNFDIELGVEGAFTTLDSNFILGGTDDEGWLPPGRYSGLYGSTDEETQVKEERYEPFFVSNWRPSSELSIEASLVAEISEITLDGYRLVDPDEDNYVPNVSLIELIYDQDDYKFWKPKIDIRYDITSQLQFRTTIDKDVSQLNFRDYTTRPDGDLEKDADSGNADLVQEKTWRYEFNLEFRLPNDGGLLNAKLFYHDIEDHQDRVDSTVYFDENSNPIPAADLSPSSVPGNIGDAKRYGIELDSSFRLGFIDLPEAVLTARLNLQDSKVRDPFLDEDRRVAMGGRGNWHIGFRHDVTKWNLNYGFNYNAPINGANRRVDVDTFRNFERFPGSRIFAEKVAFDGIRFRLDIFNVLDNGRCLQRTRYDGFTAGGNIEEIENSCVGTGRKVGLKIRTTF